MKTQERLARALGECGGMEKAPPSTVELFRLSLLAKGLTIVPVETLRESIESADRRLRAYEKACEDRPWEEIRADLVEAGWDIGDWSAEGFEAYLKQGFYHQLNSIVQHHKAMLAASRDET